MSPQLDPAAIVTELVEREISEGALGPGARLPTERELAQMAGVGRAAVRRTLGCLEAEGRVVRHVGRGTFVAPVASARTKGDGELETSPVEIMTVRALLEPGIMRLVVMSATNADFAEMERCLRGGEQADDYMEWEAWDTALHRSLVAATHNNFLAHIGDMISSARTHPAWGSLKQRSSTEERRDQYRGDHQEIFRALRERDASQAESAMRHHLSRVRGHLIGGGAEDGLVDPLSPGRPG
jgi:DNA-binding FadR family transcriptional regulator